MPVANLIQKYSRAGGKFTKKLTIDIVTRIYSRINRIINEKFNNQLTESVKKILTTSGSSPNQDLSNQTEKVA
jgi:hypothetical protein